MLATRPFSSARARSAALVPAALLPALLLTACGDRAPTAPARPADGPRLATTAASGRVVVSQVYGGGGNSGATLKNDFIELYNAGTDTVSLAGWSVQYAAAAGTTWQVTRLAGAIAPGRYYLVQQAAGTGGTASLPAPDATGTIPMSATAGKVALVSATTVLTGSGCPVAASVVSFVGYGSTVSCSEGTGPTAALTNTTAALRLDDGRKDTRDNAADFVTGAPNPRNGSVAPAVPPPAVDAGACGTTFTPAHAIQGGGAATPFAGQVVTTEGVVVGDYEGAQPALRGFYLQDAAGDGDATTSDAVFVFNDGADQVKLGDVVRVRGTAGEFQGQTQVTAGAVVTCGSDASVAPADVTLPVASADFLERYEGMLVRLPQSLTVTEHFQLGRFGQVVLASGGRLPQPTSVAAPGAAAAEVAAQNARNRLVVDDATNAQNPDPILFARGGSPLSAANTLRAGDVATGTVGVLTYTWGGNAASPNAYRVRTVSAMGGGVPSFQATNQRPAAAPAVGGTLTTAAMNLLNYFNTFTGCTNGVGGAPSTNNCRGAEDAAEFDRQWPKTVAAITALDPDVLGVNEIENDGYGAGSAIAHLVERLNAAAGAGTYAFVDADAGTGKTNALGTDAIKVGLIYKPARVTPVGVTAALNTTAFVNGGDPGPRNRAALAQAFEQRSNGARVVVSVNHLKSKGSACTAPDAGDGQGNCNAVRTAAARELAKWLASDPTDTGEPDVLILGDLNSYAQEDPITALGHAGYTNLVAQRVGAGAYSYAFDGQWGYLDHALATASLAPHVTGVAEWHINADEPSVLDYNLNFKTPGQVGSLYAADQFRVADHDPVVVGLNLPAPFPFRGFLAPVANAPAVNEVRAGSAVPVKFGLGGDRGLGVFVPGYPRSRAVACESGAPGHDVAETAGAGQSGLSYDAATDTYTYVWRTERTWASTDPCRELVVRLSDGSQHTARFRFTR